MTIATRNRFVRISTIISLILAIGSIISIVMIVTHGKIHVRNPELRPLPFLEGFFLTPYSPLASLCAIGIFPFFALTGLIYILFAFEKTQTVEITFFAACVFAISFEAARLLIPLYELGVYGSFFSVTISRFVFFSRIFTLLTLLASAIFATGNTVQQMGPSIFLLAFFSFSLANSLPLDSGKISTAYLISSGYQEMLNFFFLLVGFLSIVSYLILGKTRGISEYSRAAGGVLLLFAGYTLLSACDSWLFFIAGSVLLFTGASFYLKPMHQYYLWQ